MRSLSTSPLWRSVMRHRLLLAPMLIWLMVPVTAGSSLWFLAALLLLGVAELAFVLGWWGRRPFLTAIRRLHGTLRWFGADLITWHRPEQREELRARLDENGFGIHEVGAASMRSGGDFARALEAAFGPMAFPRDPAEKAVAILAKLGLDRARPHAVLLRDVDELAANDPAVLARFCTLWSEVMSTQAVSVVVFCEAKNANVAPEAAPPPVPRRAPQDRAAVPSVDAAPAEAERAFWWQRRPGELLR